MSQNVIICRLFLCQIFILVIMSVTNYLLQLSLICPISAPDTASTSSPPGPPSGECTGCSSSRRPGGSLRRARAAGPPSTVRYCNKTPSRANWGLDTLVLPGPVPSAAKPQATCRTSNMEQFEELEQFPILQTVTLQSTGRKPMNMRRVRGQEDVKI